MATLGSLIVELRTNSARFQQGLNQANAQLNNINRTASVVRNSLGGLFAGVSAGFIGGAIINEIRSFEKNMSVVGAVSGANADQMEALTARARELGATTGFSAAEAAQGMVALGQAGLNADQSLAAIGDTLNLAAAGGLDLGRAADIATNVMSQFGLEAGQAGRVADVMAAAAASSNTNVEGLGLALSYAGPVAATLGISLEETAAAIGVLSNAGLKGEKAGTGLRTVLSRLLDPTKEVSDVLQRLGVDTSNLSSIDDLFSQFARAGLTASDAVKIFGIEGQGAAMILTRMLPDLQRLDEKFMTSAGAAAEMARIMRDNLDGDLKALSSTISELMLQTGDAGLTGALRTGTQALTGMLRVATGAQSMEQFRAEFGAISMTVELLAIALSTRLLTALTATTQATFVKMAATRAENLALVENATRTAAATGAKLAYNQMLLAEAQATVAAATGMQRLTLAQTLLIPAQQRATAASAAHTAALSAQAAAAARASISARAASMALALFGGPMGLAITAVAGAVYLLATRTSESASAANLARDANLQLNAVLGDPAASQVAIQNAKATAEARLQEAEATLAVVAAEAEKRRAYANSVSGSQGQLGATADVIAFANEGKASKIQSEIDALRGSLGEADTKLASLGSGGVRDPLTGLGLGGIPDGTSGGTGGGGSGQPKTSFADVISPFQGDVDRIQAQINGTEDLLDQKLALASASEKLGRSLTQNETNAVLTAMDTHRKLNAELAWRNQLESEGARILESLKTPMDTYAANVANLLTLLEAKIITQEQFNQALANENTAMDQASKKTEEAMSTMTEFAVQAARNMETAMGQFFFDTMQGRMGDMVGSFKSMIDRMVAEYLASQLMSAMFGGFGKNGSTDLGGWVGAGLNALSGIFGGARATGGPVSANRAYIVGEKGPELFSPNGSGNIIPNHRLGGGGVTVIVNTPDANSFRASEGQIAAQINRAVNRGRRNL